MKQVAGALLVAALLLAAPAASRAAPAAWGVTGGVVGARMHGDYGGLFDDYRAGGAVGAHVRFTPRPGVSFQPELWWVLKGAHTRLTFTGLGFSSTLEASHSIPYLEVPLLLRLHLPTDSPVEPFLVVGPSVALRVGGRLEVETDPPALPAGVSPRVQRAQIFESFGTFGEPDYRDWDWGVLGGAGVVLGHGRVRTDIQVRYARGFADVLPSPLGDGSTNGVIGGFVGIEVH